MRVPGEHFCMRNISFSSRTTKKVLIIILLLLLVSSLGLMGFLKITYDRSFPRVDKAQPAYTGYLRYSDVAEYTRREVEFKSGVNILKGYLYGEQNTKGLVVISHGLGFGSENYLAEILYFVDKGWCVFAYDNTGTHASEGKSTIGPSQSLLDLRAALTYIHSISPLNSLNIMLYGHSWGAYAVTAILEYNFTISAVASIAGFNSAMGLLQEQASGLLGIISPITYPFLWIQQKILFGDVIDVSATDGINNTDTPVMIIHGVQDEAVSYYRAGIIAHQNEINNPNVQYVAITEENHNGHNNIPKSDAAIKYIKLLNQEYKKLYESYNKMIPDHLRLKYYEDVDRFQVSELDVGFMGEINSFFEQHL